MSRNNIESCIKSVVREQKAKHDEVCNKIAYTRGRISDANRLIEQSMKVFSHHQLVENASNYGDDVRSLVSEKEKKFVAIQHDIQSNSNDISRLQENLVSAKEARKKERDMIESTLTTDTKYIALQNNARQKNEILVGMENTLDSLLDEVNQKLPAYQDDDVFQYLLRSGYSTPEYSKNAIVSFFDGILARKTYFSLNLEHFNLLVGIKNKASIEIETAKTKFEDAMAEADEYRDSAFSSEEMKRMELVVNNIKSKIMAAQSAINDLQSSLGRYKSFSDDLSMTAKSIIYKAIENRDLTWRGKLAMQTSSDEDNKAVNIIGEQLNIIENCEDLIVDLERDKKVIDENLVRANEMKRKINGSSRLSGDRYEYGSNREVISVLESFVVGAITSSALSSALESQSRYVPPPPPPPETNYGGSYGGSSRSSESDDSTFKTSDSITSGSFSTTDSF